MKDDSQGQMSKRMEERGNKCEKGIGMKKMGSASKPLFPFSPFPNTYSSLCFLLSFITSSFLSPSFLAFCNSFSISAIFSLSSPFFFFSSPKGKCRAQVKKNVAKD